MSNAFSLTRDVNGYNGFGLQFTDTAYQATLTANTNTTLTVPSGSALGRSGASINNKFIAIFTFDPGVSVWVANNATASNPGGASFAATNSELNPAARLVNGGDVLNFYTTGTGVNASVAFYAIPGG